jgi:hypothetical protein
MPSTGLGWSHPLTNEKIDELVTKKSAGVYVLGYLKTEKKNGKEVKTFIVKYVGRADSDLNDRLKKWVGKYKRFKFGYCSSPKDAFEKECEIYHDFGETDLDNKMHPDRPDESKKWQCPRCDKFKEKK